MLHEYTNKIKIIRVATTVVLGIALVVPLAVFALGDLGEIDTGPSAPPTTDPNANTGALGEDITKLNLNEQCRSFTEGACANLDNTGGTAPGFGEGGTPIEPGDYLSRLYNFLLGLVGVAAMGSIVYGGVLYIISAGNPSSVGAAKQAIWNGVIGILVAGFGYLILFTINPDLVGGFDLQSIVNRNLGGSTGGTGAAGSNVVYNPDATFQDILNAPDNSTISYGGGSITKTGDTITDCDISGCASHSISALEKSVPKTTPIDDISYDNIPTP